jgi:hypothetical protein
MPGATPGLASRDGGAKPDDHPRSSPPAAAAGARAMIRTNPVGVAGDHHKIAPLALVIAVRGPSARLPALCKPSN